MVRDPNCTFVALTTGAFTPGRAVMVTDAEFGTIETAMQNLQTALFTGNRFRPGIEILPGISQVRAVRRDGPPASSGDPNTHWKRAGDATQGDSGPGHLRRSGVTKDPHRDCS